MARLVNKKTPNAKPIINITISEELLKKVEDHQFENRIPNPSKAICELIENGLLHFQESKKLKKES